MEEQRDDAIVVAGHRIFGSRITTNVAVFLNPFNTELVSVNEKDPLWGNRIIDPLSGNRSIVHERQLCEIDEVNGVIVLAAGGRAT